ncbi:MAG: hypothetical protein M3328_01700, partial [Chloroflexota bacterium]|nr:hypothetical protein [Chloroflexota bacterium]
MDIDFGGKDRTGKGAKNSVGRLRNRRALRAIAVPLMLCLILAVAFASPLRARADTALPCSTSGTWTQGEVNLYWFDVE